MKNVQHVFFAIRFQTACLQPAFADDEDGVDLLPFLEQNSAFRMGARNGMCNQLFLGFDGQRAEQTDF